MGRISVALGMGLALCGLFLGAAMWLRSALGDEFRRGVATGRADVALEAAQALEAARAASQSALARTQVDVAELAIQRDRLQENFDELEREIAKSAPGADGAGPVCFGPDLLRALSGVGRNRPGLGPGP